MTKLILRRPVSWASELARFVEMHARSSAPIVRRGQRAPRPEVPDRVVVSLTTIPDRIDRLRPTLNSLVDQSRRPDAIYLNLPERSRREQRHYELPDFLREFDSLVINRCGEDLGPATKLLPTLERETAPDTRIVVTDDDQIYPRVMIETLVGWSERLPEAVVAARGFAVPARYQIELRNTLLGEHLDAPEPIEILQGSGSYLTRTRFFTKEVFDYSGAPPESFFQDDIWFSAHLAKRGIERLVVPFPNCYSRIATWSARNTRSLWGGENESGHVDETMLRYFADRWQLVDAEG